MTHRAPCRAAPAGAVFLLALLLAAAPAARAQGVRVAATPTQQTVDPGAEFEVDLTVILPGAAFNGFDAVVSYDPAALTFLPASPLALQQGCLMTGLCSGACGNTFHRFDAAGDSLEINDVLLCDQFSLTGPGQIYQLRFRASNTVQLTHVRLRSATFYDAGLYVTPVTTTDATVGIGIQLGVGGSAPASGLRLSAGPNPARAAVTFTLESDRPGGRTLEVHDLLGRLVRVLPGGGSEPGVRRVEWDGRDASGARAAAGVYLVTLRVDGRSARTRVCLLP